jgi:hypothetical protein
MNFRKTKAKQLASVGHVTATVIGETHARRNKGQRIGKYSQIFYVERYEVVTTVYHRFRLCLRTNAPL